MKNVLQLYVELCVVGVVKHVLVCERIAFVLCLFTFYRLNSSCCVLKKKQRKIFACSCKYDIWHMVGVGVCAYVKLINILIFV